MTEMVDRVARAIYRADFPLAFEDAPSVIRERHLAEARAAITAMRVPTVSMVDAAWIETHDSGFNPDGALVKESSTFHARRPEDLPRDTAYEVWQAMIDEALK